MNTNSGTNLKKSNLLGTNKLFGLDVNYPVFLISSGLAILFSSLVLIFPESSTVFYLALGTSLFHVLIPCLQFQCLFLH